MRARNLKPGFFKNEYLLSCEPLARLLFEGLWCMADREGRLEDRPMKIKIEVLPCDNCDVDKLLNDLHSHGLIIRYEIEGSRYIFIPTFLQHNKPHIREQASTIPAYMDSKAKPRHDLGAGKPALNPESPLLNPECSSTEEARPEEVFVLPDWIDRKTWDDFMEVRKVKKAAQTIRAWNLIINELIRFQQNGHDPNKIIEKSIRNSWKDVFEPKENQYAAKPTKLDLIAEGVRRARAKREQESSAQAG